MNPTSGGHPIVGSTFITTTIINQIVAVVNPTGNTPALTITIMPVLTQIHNQ